MFQNFALLEDETVLENLNLVQKHARAAISAEQALEKVGLLEKKDAKVYQLSGGEQQRVALARLMYKQCSIILADEPTGSLDAENARVVLQILHRLNDQGKTIVLVTHSEKIMETEQNVLRLKTGGNGQFAAGSV